MALVPNGIEALNKDESDDEKGMGFCYPDDHRHDEVLPLYTGRQG